MNTSALEPQQRRQLLVLVMPAMILPFLSALFYFVLFSHTYFARVLYAGTKVFTLVWPLFALVVVMRYRSQLQQCFRVPAVSQLKKVLLQGLLSGLAIAGLLFFLMYTPLGDIIQGGSGAIKAKSNELGVIKYYFVFAIFISVFHSLLEEYYWRWFVFGSLQKMTSLPTAHALAALSFAAHHIVVASQFFGLFWGICLGLCVGVGGFIWTILYQRQGCIYGIWISHMLVDLAIMRIGFQLITVHGG